MNLLNSLLLLPLPVFYKLEFLLIFHGLFLEKLLLLSIFFGREEPIWIIVESLPIFEVIILGDVLFEGE